MKKNILKLIFASVFVLLAGYGVYNSQQEEVELSDLAIANVEALAGGENATPCGGSKVMGECQSRNTVNCKDNYGCQ
ncbi:MAG: NVEALA domain-containing protein [Bacteroides sp.]|nr:NVEALA domain-containing protein [Bacteroides sp.]